MTQGERVKEIRKYLNLTLEKFGEKLGVGKTAISKIEKNERSLTDQMAKSICREFNVNEHWLRTGEGEMFIELPEEDETAAIVYELLGPEKNELFDLILEVIRTYKELSPSSQQVMREFCKKYIENIKRKGD